VPLDLPKVDGNPGQIEQVLLNICLNARDALEETRSDVEPLIRLRAGVSDDGSISIRISDNGPGMDECIRRRVFEPFFTTKEVGRGTGLGLASAYAIVSEHRGRISCESALGVGTTFQLELPAARQGQLTTIAPASLPLPAASETVLLIDDEPMVRRAASAMLSYGGYRVLEAEDGRDAIRLFEQARSEIDLIILDRSMPGLSGEQVAQRLHQIDPRVPIVLLSGQAGYSQTRMVAAAALPKPVDADVLLRTLREVIDRSRAAPTES
jgi:CheY-like chemotaxis protein